MGKVYIGVMAVVGYKLWGVMGGGRLTAGDGKVAGRACPASTGWWKGEQVPAGNGQAEGSRPLPTM